tara:strand:+ start:1548 stop:2417 length:870 start_codon:yes stop_codon:yes gene_type:complete
MKPQFDNKVMSSFFLWFDNKLLDKGEAFENVTGKFYDASEEYGGYSTYASSYSQFVADASITGATIPTGLYVGQDNLVNVGQGGATGLFDINYLDGKAYFSGDQTADITGSFAIKDFNVYLTNQPEDKILFETKYTERNRIDLTPTGLEAGTKTYPVVYLKSMGSSNEPIAFGGQDQTTINVRAIVLAQSQFELDAVGSIFRDTQKTLVPLFDEDEMPFNSFGGYKDKVQYNFTGVAAGKGSQNSCFVEEVFVSNLERGVQSRIRDLNPDIFTNIIDFELTKFRYPRNC